MNRFLDAGSIPAASTKTGTTKTSAEIVCGQGEQGFASTTESTSELGREKGADMPSNMAVCSLLFARWERLVTVTASRTEINAYLYQTDKIARFLPHIETDTIGRVGKHYKAG